MEHSVCKFCASVCDKKFSSLAAYFFSLRCLAASASSFLPAAINLHPPSVTVSTHTSVFNAVAFQSPAMPNARMSLCTQPVYSFSFPPRPPRTSPSRFPNTIRFGSRSPLIRMNVPAHKKVFSCATLSQCSRTGLSQGHGCTRSSDGGLVSCEYYCGGRVFIPVYYLYVTKYYLQQIALHTLELGRCSSDLFLSSRPRTGLATTCIIGYG